MSLPRVLLVDDSEAVLAFGRAALAGYYEVETASTGVQALERIAAGRPELVLLDLSMPEMDGGEVLRRLKAAESLPALPVIVVSSETSREAECLKAGAALFLSKPTTAPRLRSAVHAVLEEAGRLEREGTLAVLPVGVGPQDLALPLSAVEAVLFLPAVRALPAAPAAVLGFFELRGEPVCVLDLAARLGVTHAAPLLERKVVVVRVGSLRLALCVDRVQHPEEHLPADVVSREQLGGAGRALLRATLLALVPGKGTRWPLLDPAALFSKELVRGLPALLAGAAQAPWEPGSEGGSR